VYSLGSGASLSKVVRSPDLAIEALHISVPALVGEFLVGSTSALAYES
jgi:hypothetical protein